MRFANYIGIKSYVVSMTRGLDNATNTVQAEWGFVYQGEVLISAVDEQGKYQVEKLGVGDIWYFPKGQAHAIQGLSEENEFLLAFDDGDFNAVGYASAIYLPFTIPSFWSRTRD